MIRLKALPTVAIDLIAVLSWAPPDRTIAARSRVFDSRLTDAVVLLGGGTHVRAAPNLFALMQARAQVDGMQVFAMPAACTGRTS